MADDQLQAKRFASLTKENISTILENKDAVNTKRSTQQAVRLFRNYLQEKGLPVDFESWPASRLDTVLATFYAEARTEQGHLYKKSTLHTIRHGLNRHVMSETDINIMKDTEFKESSKTFVAVCKDLKRQGFGGIQHHPPIEDTDLKKMYEQFNQTDPKQLQWKVFCDVMLYFGRRGRENLRELKISDFACTSDADNLMYIYIVRDEQTKNHQDDTNTASGRMYELRDNGELCPVKTFMKYKRRLSSDCSFLFQRPLKLPSANVWYGKSPIGPNKLGSMMPDISKEFGLSRQYTNHSLRATAVHILDAAQFPGRHIMSLTGHKCETSLKTYTGYTDSKTKQKMSCTISSSLMTDRENGASHCDNVEQMSDFTLQPLSNSQYDDLLDDLNADTEFDNVLRTLQIPLCTENSWPATVTQPIVPTSNGNQAATSTVTQQSIVPRPQQQIPIINNYGTIYLNINYGSKV